MVPFLGDGKVTGGRICEKLCNASKVCVSTGSHPSPSQKTNDLPSDF